MSERRSQQREGAEDRIAGVLVAAGDAFTRKQGAELLAWAEAARQLTEGRSPEERRTLLIAWKSGYQGVLLVGEAISSRWPSAARWISTRSSLRTTT